MEVDFDSIINHCDSQINLLKNKRLTEIKEEAREYSRKIECNEYKTQEELIDVKNKVIKLKQEYNDIMSESGGKTSCLKGINPLEPSTKSRLEGVPTLLEQNKNDEKIKIVRIPYTDEYKKEKKCFTNVNNNNKRKKFFEKKNKKMDNNENDIKILSFNDFMKKLMYDDFSNDKN